MKRENNILLTAAGYSGTLAAIRAYGRAGCRVYVADSNRFAPGAWSRFVTKRLICPPTYKSDAHIEWLLQFGKQHPGTFLYPTSDDGAFLYAQERDRLQEHLLLSQPDLKVIVSLLDKRKLLSLANEVGIESPMTCFPSSREEAEALKDRLEFPVLVKPSTQMLNKHKIKGTVVHAPNQLGSTVEATSRQPFGARLLNYDPSLRWPIVQVFHRSASTDIYSISGFIDISGESILRASRKVLQQPRTLGIGICFEDAAVDTVLSAKLLQLCKRVGYCGVFEAEFIVGAGSSLLIDFNPRFYGQMAFDVARGVDLPMLAWAMSARDEQRMKLLFATANAEDTQHARGYVHSTALEILLSVQALSGAMSKSEIRAWRKWLLERNGFLVDAMLDVDDWRPGVVDIAQQVLDHARHPRAFFRKMVLNRAS